MGSPREKLFAMPLRCLMIFSVEQWDEGSIRACMYLYLNLLPLDHDLIDRLAIVYAQSSTDVKKVDQWDKRKN